MCGGGVGGEINEAEMKKALRIFAVAIKRPNIAIFYDGWQNVRHRLPVQLPCI